MDRVLLLLLVTKAVSGYVFYESYRRAACGEIISGKDGIVLPDREACDLKVEVPEGSTFVFSLVGGEASLDCSRIFIVDETTQAKYPLCPSMTFSGTSRLYSIQLKNLRQPMKAHLDFDDSILHCGQLVRRERLEHPLTLVKDKPAFCYLVLRTSDILVFQRNGFSAECDTHIEVTQGRNIRKMVKSTGSICLGEAPVEVDISCGLAIVYFDASIGSSLNITSLPSRGKELQKILDCPNE